MDRIDLRLLVETHKGRVRANSSDAMGITNVMMSYLAASIGRSDPTYIFNKRGRVITEVDP